MDNPYLAERGISNLTRLVILSLLQYHPMHGYEIQQYIREQKMEQWTDILSGSIYFALSQMEKEGLIRADAEERTGNRIRKIFAITDNGRKAYLDLLRQALSSPPHNLKSEFSLGLGFITALPHQERTRLLLENIRNLEQSREFWETGRDVKSHLHPTMKALFDNDLELIERDLRFLHQLLEINEKSVEETTRPTRRKATHFILRTTGKHQGNPFTYQETVPIAGYQESFWWQKFQSKQAEEILHRASDALDMDFFTINDPGTHIITEVMAICKEGES